MTIFINVPSYEPLAMRITLRNKFTITSSRNNNLSVLNGLNKEESTIQYFPVERKEIEYKDNTYIERVPRTKKVIEYK